MNKIPVILASTSPSRKNLLSALKIPFEIKDSQVDEEKIQDKNPEKLVAKRAEAKGKAVEKILNIRVTPRMVAGCHPDFLQSSCYLIIAADSMAAIGNKTIGKIADLKQQKKVLHKELSGKTHQFLTAVWIKNTQTQKVWNKVGKSFVSIRKLSKKEIDRYARSDDLSQYAGAYSITNSRQDFVTKIEGSLTNVIGLPLEILLPILQENGYR